MTKTRGFTLIEILVSSAIFTLVALLISASFYAGIFGYRTIEKNIKSQQMARLIIQRMNRDLKNSVAWSKTNSGFSGDKNQLNFMSISESYLLVNYKFEENTLTREILKNGEVKNKKQRRRKSLAFYPIENASFKYGFISGRDKSLKWKEIWKEQEGLPIAVRIDLSLGENENYNFSRLITLPIAKNDNS